VRNHSGKLNTLSIVDAIRVVKFEIVERFLLHFSKLTGNYRFLDTLTVVPSRGIVFPPSSIQPVYSHGLASSQHAHSLNGIFYHMIIRSLDLERASGPVTRTKCGRCRRAIWLQPGFVLLTTLIANSAAAQQDTTLSPPAARAIPGWSGVETEAARKKQLDQDARSSKVPPKLLVLTSGRVVHGSIRAEEHGFSVETPQSTLFFAFEHVRFAAADLQEAHRRMCKSLGERSVQREIVLGRWCIENSLIPEAAAHFRDVLKLDATNREAKDSLARLESMLPTAPSTEVAGRAVHSRGEGQRPESLSRLAPSTVSDFVAGVQPLLLARCGSLKCHGGPAATSFRLERVRFGNVTRRDTTSRNLDRVLDQLAPQFPSRSPLLEKGLRAHGGSDRKPLEAWAAVEQQARLKRWVTTAAADLNRLKRDDVARNGTDRFNHLPERAPIRDANVFPAAAIAPENATNRALANGKQIAAPNKLTNGEKPDAPQPIGPLTDPFDPNEFNSQQHQR
jgi:hypothetical protein